MPLRLPSSSLVQVGGKHERFFWLLGFPRDASFGTKHGMNPGDEAQAPICCVQADETGMDLVEAYGPR